MKGKLLSLLGGAALAALLSAPAAHAGSMLPMLFNGGNAPSSGGGGGGGLTPTQVPSYVDQKAGVMITPFVVNGAAFPSTGSCSSNDSVYAATTYTFQGDSYSACYLYNTRDLTTSDRGAHYATVTAVNGSNTYSATVEIDVGDATPTTPPSYINRPLQGLAAYDGGSLPSGVWGFYRNYVGPCAVEVGDPSAPATLSFTLFDPANSSGCNMGSLSAAASGSYTSTWKSALDSAVDAGIQIVDITVNNEWEGTPNGTASCSGDDYSPYYNVSGCSEGDGSGILDATEYKEMIKNFANMVHTDPKLAGIKVGFQGPMDNNSDINFWLGLEGYMDYTGSDWYYFSQWDDSSYLQEWTDTFTPGHASSPGKVADVLLFAASRGLPLVTDEYCDDYTDDGGYLLGRFELSLSAGNWALGGLWDSDGNAYGCYFGTNSGTAAVYNDLFSSYSYDGTLFP